MAIAIALPPASETAPASRPGAPAAGAGRATTRPVGTQPATRPLHPSGRTLVVGGDWNYPPYEQLDAAGRPVGFHVDLMRAIGELMGLRVVHRLGPWPEVKSEFEAGRIDALPLFKSPERADRMEFCRPHDILHYVIFIRRDSPPVESVSETNGREVIVQSGSLIEEYLREHSPRARLVTVATEADGIRLLASGKHDCAILTEVGGEGFVRRHKVSHITTSGPPLLPREYCFAVAKGNTALRDRIDQALAILRATGRFREMRARWLPAGPGDRNDDVLRVLRYAAGAVVPVCLLAGGALAWSWSLKRKVRHRTRELESQLAATKRAEQRRAQLEEQLVQAQKMEAIGRLAGGVAHDFNNQLTVILGYADMLLGVGSEDDPARAELLEIRRAGERSRKLISQLLAFGRKQVLRPEVLDLGRLLEELRGGLARMLGEDVDLTVAAGRGLWPVKVDRMQFEQALMNLVANARDAMPKGGQLAVEALNVELGGSDLAEVRDADARPGAFVRVTVRDTGVGMDDVTRSGVFEPFFTTKEVGKGTGLGLSMVYGLVKQSRGLIDVDSRPGQGATFRIYLPRSEAPVGAGEGEPAPAPDMRGSETVLVVEDDQAVGDFLGRVLRACGYHVLAARDAEEARRASEGHAGRIHLLLADVVMPRTSGPELARELLAVRPELKVLYVSGHAEEVIAGDGVLPRGYRLLAKPVAPEALARTVREVLDAPRPGGPPDPARPGD